MAGNIIDATFVHSFERRMATIQENEYVRRLADRFTWWTKVSKTRPMQGATERLAWFLETATIDPVGPAGSGSISFEELVTQQAVYPTFRHGKGIKVERDQLEFLDGTGLNTLAEWSRMIGNEIAYVPQRLMAQMILNGGNTDGSANAYDGCPYFVNPVTGAATGFPAGHPLNPFDPSIGGYFNWLTGSPSGNYPGALPIDDRVTVDTALENLGKIIAWISTVKMPNGKDPRMLSPVFIFAPPAMAPRLRQLTHAKVLAMTAGAYGGAGGGSADVEALITGWGLGEPIIAQELQASQSYSTKMPVVVASSGNTSFMNETVTGSDTTCYLFCVEAATSQLGALLYLTSSPFQVRYYTGDTGGTGMDAVLARANEFEYHVQGRISTGFGHPYACFKIGP